MKRYCCENCGKEISQEEYEMHDGLCEERGLEEEDADLFLGGGL